MRQYRIVTDYEYGYRLEYSCGTDWVRLHWQDSAGFWEPARSMFKWRLKLHIKKLFKQDARDRARAKARNSFVEKVVYGPYPP